MRKLKLLTLILLLGTAVAAAAPRPESPVDRTAAAPDPMAAETSDIADAEPPLTAEPLPATDVAPVSETPDGPTATTPAGDRAARAHGDRGRGTASAGENRQPAACRARHQLADQPLRPQGTMGLRRYGLLFDPQQPRLRRARNRRHHLRRLHLQGQSDDRLRAGQQLDARRALHLRPHAAQTRRGERQLRQRRLVDRPERRLLLRAAPLLFVRCGLPPLHPLRRVEALRHLHRHPAALRRLAG